MMISCVIEAISNYCHQKLSGCIGLPYYMTKLTTRLRIGIRTDLLHKLVVLVIFYRDLCEYIGHWTHKHAHKGKDVIKSLICH